MDGKDGIRRAKSKYATPGWVLVVLGAWTIIDNLSTAITLPNTATAVWDFMSTTYGSLIVLALGIIWLTLLISQPAFLRKIPGMRRSDESTEPDPGNRLAKAEEKVSSLEAAVGSLWEKVDPTPIVEDIDETRKKIEVSYERTSFDHFGGIERAIVISFLVANHSSIAIQPTSHAEGFLIVERNRIRGANWRPIWDAPALQPNEKRRLDIYFPVCERLADTLAFKAEPNVGSVRVNFSLMSVEFAATAGGDRQQTVGYVPLGGEEDIPVVDNHEFKEIRTFYKWRKGLEPDEHLPS